MIDRDSSAYGRTTPSHVGARAFAVLTCLAISSSVLVGFLPVTSRGAPDTWTFMVYMNADNDLEDHAIDDFLEMASVDSASNLNIVVQFDRYGGLWGYQDDTRFGNWTDSRRFVVTKGMDPTADNSTVQLGEVDMASAQTLVDFVNWSIANYPATRYVLDMWDHGADWYGVSWDYTNNSMMRLSHLSSALAELKTYHPSLTFDIIAFDECSMGSIEVAHEVAGYANYMLASEVRVPDDGFNYSSLQAIVDNPDIPVLDLTARFMIDYASYYYSLVGTPKEYMLNESFSLSTIDLNAVGTLAQAVDSLAFEMIFAMDSWRDAIYEARNLTEDYSGWRSHDIVDIYHMSERLGESLWFNSTAQALLTNVMDAFNASVVSEIHGTNPANCTLPVDNVHGLTVNYPGADAYFDQSYLSINSKFQNDTLWDEFLAAAYIGRPHAVLWEPTGDSVLSNAVITIWLSEPLDVSLPFNVRLYPTGQSGNWVEGTLSYYSTGYRLEFVPNTPLLPGTNYTVDATWFDYQLNRGNWTYQFSTEVAIPEFPSTAMPLFIVLAVLFISRKIIARKRT